MPCGQQPPSRGPAQRVAHLGTAGAHLRGPGLPRSSSPPFPLPAGPGTAAGAHKHRAGETAASRLHDGTQSHHVFVSTRRLTPCWTQSRPGGLGLGRLRAGTAPHQDLPRRPDRPLQRRLQRGSQAALLQVGSRRAATIYLHIQGKIQHPAWLGNAQLISFICEIQGKCLASCRSPVQTLRF